MHRVVVTGMGLCTPLGRGKGAFWRNLAEGRSGLGPLTLFDVSALPVRIGGEVKDFDLVQLREFPEAAQVADRKVWLGLDAIQQAIQDADLPLRSLEAAALYVGVSLEAFALERLSPAAHAADLSGAFIQQVLSNKSRRLQTPLDCLTQLAGDHYRIAGGRWTNCSACAAGAQAIGEAFRRLRDGELEIAVAGAADSILNPLGLGGFSLLRVLSTENERPQTACRPFDATRQGTVLSEGAAFMVLEIWEHAWARGAEIHGEVAGYGTSFDAYRVSDPEPAGRGAVLCMRRAMADAGLRVEDIDSVNAHGTGTPKNDLAETLALKQTFGARAYTIPISANKSMTGHMIAASGAVEGVASVLSLGAQCVPPTINLDTPDPECDLDFVAHGARAFSGRTVLSNSFGFGGQNAALIFRRHEF